MPNCKIAKYFMQCGVKFQHATQTFGKSSPFLPK